MSKQKKFVVVGVFSCTAILLGVAGCGNSEPADSGPVQAVQSDPNMSPQAKAAIEASTRQGQAQGEAAARAAAQRAPK